MGADEAKRSTIAGIVYPIREEEGGQPDAHVEAVSRRVGLLVGDLALASFEGKLAEAWNKCLESAAAPFRAMSTFHMAVQSAGDTWGAEVALIDVGPNLGALNRAALLAADWIVTPLNADLFSIQGLRNLGPTLGEWRALQAGRFAKAFGQWAVRIPGEYARAIGSPLASEAIEFEHDAHCLGVLKNYRSLMALAHEARKPVFMLTAADGALGAHATAARAAAGDFLALAAAIDARTGGHPGEPPL